MNDTNELKLISKQKIISKKEKKKLITLKQNDIVLNFNLPFMCISDKFAIQRNLEIKQDM